MLIFYYKQEFLIFSIAMPIISKRAFRIEGETLRDIFESNQSQGLKIYYTLSHILFRHIYVLIISF